MTAVTEQCAGCGRGLHRAYGGGIWLRGARAIAYMLCRRCDSELEASTERREAMLARIELRLAPEAAR